MKTSIKLWAITLIALVGIASLTQVQGQNKGEHKLQHKHMNKDSAFAKMSKRLNLSANQETKLKVIVKQNHDEMKALKESIKNATKEEKRKAVIAQMQKNDERVKQVLNEKQKTEYDKMKAERKAKMRKYREANKADKKRGGNRNKSTTPAQTKPEHYEGDNDEDILDDGIL
jgi:Spy/CpxP family protein refolding chaperone